jgi:hypothetical protein
MFNFAALGVLDCFPDRTVSSAQFRFGILIRVSHKICDRGYYRSLLIGKREIGMNLGNLDPRNLTLIQ